MPLSSGTRLGPYVIDGPLGAGGMGEVYRARDTRLDRPVAIKVLPTIMAESAELHERFEREARLLSNLNHPHICVVYDVGRQGDMSYLVMELLEGETLASRIARGPLPVAQATSIALQIGAALDRAHRIGVVHRDVKPENVMLTKTGAKLLDFGLAKPAPVKGELGVATRTMPITGQGTIIGTLYYMAPEQLEGRPADARSDIFAFGAVLYEMITGQRAFSGGTPVSVISSILRDTPRPIPEIQPSVPPALDAVVRTCLEKDPDDRWHSAHDLASQLRWIQQSGSQPHVPTTPVVRRRRRFAHAAWALGCLLALATGILATRYFTPSTVDRSIWFTVGEPPGTRFSRTPIAPFAAVSPDGRHIVFDASLGDAGQLYLRTLNATESRQLPGTEDAWLPFWSADSRHVAFFADGALKKTAIATGGIETICKIDDFEGGAWNQNNVIMFSKSTGGLLRVDAGGGEPTPVTTLDKTKGEVVHRSPIFLPDGQHFIYLAQPGNEVFYGSLDGTAPRRLLAADGRAVYSPPGFLLFARDGSLFAQPFDAARGQLSGDPIRVANSVRATPLSGRAAYSVSDTGVLVFRAGDARNNVQVRWTDRSGRRGETVLEEADYRGIALSPDGTRIAFHRHEDPVGGGIWLKDILRGQPMRLTTDPSHNSDPVWSPDGTRIAFTTDRNRVWDIYIRDASGTGRDQILLKSDAGKYYPSWSHDQRFLMFQVGVGASQNDIWVMPQQSGGKPQPYLSTPFNEVSAQFSPDGRWVAYASYDSGRPDVYVQPYPTNGDRYTISVGGGIQPSWRRDGREIFYLTPTGTLRVVSVEARGNQIKSGVQQSLFDFDMSGRDLQSRLYQAAADGQRFLITERFRKTDSAAVEPLTVVVNWTADLERSR